MPSTNQDAPDAVDLQEWRRQLAVLLGDDALSFSNPHDVLEYVKRTCISPDAKDFKRARLAMAVARQLSLDDAELAQQHAIFTYKDLEYSPAHRFAEALEILESIGLREEGRRDAETLRLGGAIYKRKWSFDGKLENLLEAYSFYRSAYEMDKEADLGYGGVNAAFLLDLRAARGRVIDRHSGTAVSEAAQLEEDAKALREEVVQVLDRLMETHPELREDEWFAPTYAEAHYGLGKYDEQHYQVARRWLEITRNLGAGSWELETCFRQFVSIAKAQGVELPAVDPAGGVGQRDDDENWHPAWRVLKACLGTGTRHALECYRGRVGLALSGGGFRASLYHIGVLARLAEMDALRSVEVISTVSGGSILGAQYYLELQELLEKGNDGDIAASDYVDVVDRLHKKFTAGVRKNLRMRAFINPIKNWRMLGTSDYTRSTRIGELYEKELYAEVEDKHTRQRATARRRMNDLLIAPQGKAVNPNAENWRRWARLPVLLLNATTLNSGHNWHFTAKWMGEPPGLLGHEVDKNRRYRRVYYEDLPEGVRPIYLGEAVAASACVPGLFEPMEIHNLYDEHEIRLVDGGVHDNQGVAGLLDEGCTLILCSDASGQMGDDATPSNGSLGVPLRANSILMDRVREAQYQDLAGRVDSGALQGLFYVHLKEALPAADVAWQGARDDWSEDRSEDDLYAIHPALQAKIAALRTDLDCFSQVEANALMLSGYLMTEWKFEKLQEQHEKDGGLGNWGDFQTRAPRQEDRWSFLNEEFMKILKEGPEAGNARAADLGLQLEVGGSLAFRAFHLIPILKWGARALAVVAVLGVVYGLAQVWNRPLAEVLGFSKTTIGGTAIALLLLGLAAYKPVLQWLNPQKVVKSYFTKAVAGLVFAVGSAIQVHLIDRLYRKRGSMKRLLEL